MNNAPGRDSHRDSAFDLGDPDKDRAGRPRFRLSEELAKDLYVELRRIAAAYFHNENVGSVLQPTAVAHEAYIRLMRRDTGAWPTRQDFLAAAAQTVRRVLVDHSREKKREKRGGKLNRVPLDGAALQAEPPAPDIVEIDEALAKLAELSPRVARIVELRFFAGLSVAETAAVLGVSRATVSSDWALGQAWLHRALTRPGAR